MIDVLLTHSYFLRFDPKEFRAMTPYPPLGTLYAASVLRANGSSVSLHDMMFSESEEEVRTAIALHRPRIVTIYDDQFNYLTKMCLSRMREAAFRMTAIAKEFGCTVLIFSSDATDHLATYFAHGADFVMCGEAEETLVELVHHLTGRSAVPVESIQGIAFERNGRIVTTPRRRLLEHLDVLPPPAWDLLDVNAYRARWLKRHGYFSLNLVTTRGCPFHCNWCAKPIYGQVYHSRTPQSVAAEMLQLKRTLQPDHIWFADDIFGLKPGWISTFDEVVNASDAKIPFKCLSRADLLLRENTVLHLRHAGCTSVWLGAESGSQKILDAMEKGTTVEQIRESAALLHRAGIRVGFFLQFGYPGETMEDIRKTLAMVKECAPHEIGISVSYPLPGTSFHERVKEQLLEKQNWRVSEDLDVMFQGTYQPEFYRTLHTFTHKKHQIWKGRDVLRRAVRRPLVFSAGDSRQIAKTIYHAATLLPVELKVRRLQRSAKQTVSQ